jgi:hypothetical protein
MNPQLGRLLFLVSPSPSIAFVMRSLLNKQRMFYVSDHCADVYEQRPQSAFCASRREENDAFAVDLERVAKTKKRLRLIDVASEGCQAAARANLATGF